MMTYVVLATFTDQGVKNAKDAPKRAEAFKQDGEDVWSGRERYILDARTIRRRDSRRSIGALEITSSRRAADASQRQLATGAHLQVSAALQQALVPVSAHAQRIWSAGQTRRSLIFFLGLAVVS